MGYKVLAINPGSTSTKIALFEDENEIYSENIEHAADELNAFDRVGDQFEMRKDAILSSLNSNGYDVTILSAVVGRGGMLPPVKSGAYEVNAVMVDRLKNRAIYEHASNLGALIAYEIANMAQVTAYIYDSVRVDEMNDVARISGMVDIPRESNSHALNSRAMALKLSKQLGKAYDQMNFIVAHMGGGISISVHEKGKMVDIIADDEGPFSPERAGRVPCKQLVNFCYSEKYSLKDIKNVMRTQSGLKGYLGTADARAVEKMIEQGDAYAKLIYESLAYQVSKGIGELATVVDGKVDAIILTGGIAHSKLLTSWIEKKVAFIASVYVLPGENEMSALALGALRVLRNEEVASQYSESDA
ncbi:butyrate kinase [Fusibacter ferrireducens]|uniref:Probable butyrate kinase n=1 Tax=Fusibacter ferrireducens TaxID=2785058 RepID=A0ABR9ZQ06_9FIRM|nr:butyrate kinase [Fusibacter ferrireducens]MBF4692545.1 butyrate kinase [Fusibacter ferrireducens]